MSGYIPKPFDTKLEDYSKKYAAFAKFKREDGILEVALHSLYPSAHTIENAKVSDTVGAEYFCIVS